MPEPPDVHKCVEALKVKRRVEYAGTGPLRVSLAVVYETGQRTGAQQCLRVPEVPEKRSMNRLEIWRIFVSNAKPRACRLKKVQSQSLTRMRISFPYNTFLRRKGRFSLRNRPVNAAIMMLQYSGTAKLKVEE
jgi:hypothetical protein